MKIKSWLLIISIGGYLSAFPCFAQTKTETLNLPEAERVAIYKLRKSNPSDIATLNLLPFAIGSWAQGDYLTAIGVSFCDLISIVFWGMAIEIMLRPKNSFALSDQSLAGPLLLYYGSFPFLVGRTIGFIVPWFYSETFNENLKKELNLNHADFEQKQSLLGLPLFSYSASF